MKHQLQKFERRDPFPRIPFALDDIQQVPSLSEVIGWIVIAFFFLALCIGFLGIA